MSRGSQRSLMTGDRGNGGRSGGSMKCIVTVGIILPLLAAIIGVAAWTLTNETLHKRSQPTSVHLGGHSSYRSADHIFEERNDDILDQNIEFGQKLPIGAAVNKEVIGSPLEEEREILPPSPEDQSNRDPLYVVHYVPHGKDTGPETPKPPKQDGSDVLSKILSAGKGTGKGTPQFVVFAPTPEEADIDEDDDDSARVARKRVKKRKKARKDAVEYDDDEYVENSQIKPKVAAPRQRHGDFESSEFQNNHHPHHFSHQPQYYNNHNQNQHQQTHMPCCGQPAMPAMPAMTTAAPGLTIQMGQGLPMSPLGILRQLLRPKVDLRKKLFFGVQLENGMGFGGEQPAAPAQPAQGGGGMMPAGGGMGQQGQHQGGGGMGGGMYRFG